ncbi:hypothetical protein JL722_10192 [Aureococcus anophagefferens]|nr:hypothetical protein JL722_10192 [Aureococcus anophagefferens]
MPVDRRSGEATILRQENRRRLLRFAETEGLIAPAGGAPPPLEAPASGAGAAQPTFASAKRAAVWNSNLQPDFNVDEWRRVARSHERREGYRETERDAARLKVLEADGAAPPPQPTPLADGALRRRLQARAVAAAAARRRAAADVRRAAAAAARDRRRSPPAPPPRATVASAAAAALARAAPLPDRADDGPRTPRDATPHATAPSDKVVVAHPHRLVGHV